MGRFNVATPKRASVDRVPSDASGPTSKSLVVANPPLAGDETREAECPVQWHDLDRASTRQVAMWRRREQVTAKAQAKAAEPGTKAFGVVTVCPNPGKSPQQQQ